jgi:hypothetical protein
MEDTVVLDNIEQNICSICKTAVSYTLQIGAWTAVACQVYGWPNHEASACLICAHAVNSYLDLDYMNKLFETTCRLQEAMNMGTSTQEETNEFTMVAQELIQLYSDALALARTQGAKVVPAAYSVWNPLGYCFIS